MKFDSQPEQANLSYVNYTVYISVTKTFGHA